MRQILYVSTSTTTGNAADLADILQQSRHNNALEGVTGVLWSDGRSFMQALEGPSDSVAATFERIQGDRRHHDLIVLHDRPIAAREFGSWSMVHRTAREPADAHDAQMRHVLARASEPIRAQFLALVASGEAPSAPR